MIDPNPDADGMRLARDHGIAASSDQEAMIARRDVEVIVERMRELVDAVHQAVDGIQQSSGPGRELLEQLTETERRLRDAFGDRQAEAA